MLAKNFSFSLSDKQRLDSRSGVMRYLDIVWCAVLYGIDIAFGCYSSRSVSKFHLKWIYVCIFVSRIRRWNVVWHWPLDVDFIIRAMRNFIWCWLCLISVWYKLAERLSGISIIYCPIFSQSVCAFPSHCHRIERSARIHNWESFVLIFTHGNGCVDVDRWVRVCVCAWDHRIYEFRKLVFRCIAQMELKNVINFDAIRISHDKADLKYKMNTALLGSVVGVCGFQLHNIFFLLPFCKRHKMMKCEQKHYFRSQNRYGTREWPTMNKKTMRNTHQSQPNANA